MWFARHKLNIRTSVWKLTLVFTLIVLLLNATVLAVVYWRTLGERQEQQQRNVLVAAQTYRELGNNQTLGVEGLRRLIADRTRRSATMVLALESGGEVEGNLSSLPEGLPEYPATGRFPVVVSGLQGEATVSMAVGTRLQVPAGQLLVGLIDDDQQRLQNDYLLASLLALVGALLVTLVVGFIFNRRVIGRVHRLGEQMARLHEGHLHARLPVSARGDEYDVIAGQINTMLDEIDELLQSVVSVTDNIAHDLRTPLSRIRLRLDDAASRHDPPPPWLADAITDLDQLLDTFEAMLDLSRLQHATGRSGHVACELAQICTDVEALLAPVAEARQRQLELSLAGSGRVSGDPGLLFRAVYNLVDNAIKHAGPGCRITLQQEGGTVTVADNGPGVPVAERERVFRRLYRLDQSRHTAGTGLGLSIVQAVAELHGASVELGDAGPGLVVTLQFPQQSN
ncbi:sensor histidine kinase [Kineobactrum salinum]|uniref:histidine kinase n=1 Tax=Kineobactrum salinum TaxID=2708301 RepID=A0A6C0TWW9_9GAMM|nr:HAMP domain-containing sensor histidine kinase [Kineobactrum salinum]QIB64276.1 HAMP domain-containing histidine kinase [Kineobactrum salinum]